MKDLSDLLRRQAALVRRAAAVQTDGAGASDQRLIELAEQLEREAAALDCQNPRRNPQKKPAERDEGGNSA